MTDTRPRDVSTRPTDAVAAAFDRINADGRDGIWIALVDCAAAFAAAADVERRMAAGEHLPLAGMTLAVKDNIDVAGLSTTAACPSFRYRPDTSATVVSALVDAGAVVVGKTNLDQFATGLVGTRSPYGACPNAYWPDLVSGGSSSGSAVAVASGQVDLALGTDTAGSGRVPAAANGIVGVKPTRGLVGTEGVVPACRSLDCVSVLARTVDVGVSAVRLAARRRDADPWRRQLALDAGSTVLADGRADRLRVGVPDAASLTFDDDPNGPARFAASLHALSDAAPAAEIVDVDLVPFRAAGELLYGGAFVAERFEAVGAFVATHPPDLDPVVGAIIEAAGKIPAWQVFRDCTELRRLAAVTAATWDRIDVLVVPTVPRMPARAEVDADPIGVNTMLGTYTNFVNLLDLAAITVPIEAAAAADVDATVGQSRAAPPPSITFIAPAGSDDRLARLARRVSLPAPPPWNAF